MNIRIGLSLLSIVTALSLTAGATYAFFSDSGTSSGNTFSTGTVNLLLADNNEPATNDVTASFGGTLVPGSCTGPKTLNLQNSGSVAGNHAEVKLANSVTDATPVAANAMDRFLRISTLTYDGGNISVPNSNGNGFSDLDDWEAMNATDGLDDLALSDLGGAGHNLVLDVCLDATAPNDLQGDSVSSLFTVTLNQSSTQ